MSQGTEYCTKCNKWGHFPMECLTQNNGTAQNSHTANFINTPTPMNQNNIEEYDMPSIEVDGHAWIRMVDHIALTEKLHQELQKAREEERERIAIWAHNNPKDTGENHDMCIDLNELLQALTQTNNQK